MLSPLRERTDLALVNGNKPVLRDVMDVMEFGFVSISKGRTTPIVYRDRDHFVQVTANVTYGMATIWDWDVMIGLVSLVNGALHEGRHVCSWVTFRPGALLRFIGKSCGGANYQELAAAIRRLRHTGITTSIRLDDHHGEERPFSFIEDYRIPQRYSTSPSQGVNTRTPDKSGVWEVQLPHWILNALTGEKKGILKIDSGYFGLSSGIARFLYRHARKTVPAKLGRWKIGISRLYVRSGSCGSFYDFQSKVRMIAKVDLLPEYRIVIDGAGRGAMVFFFIRKKEAQVSLRALPELPLDLDDEIPY